jgi:Glycosyl transferases group 1
MSGIPRQSGHALPFKARGLMYGTKLASALYRQSPYRHLPCDYCSIISLLAKPETPMMALKLLLKRRKTKLNMRRERGNTPSAVMSPGILRLQARIPLRIGFGPRTNWNSFYQSGQKVAEVLGKDPRFECGFFGREPFSLDELSGFDVLLFIKHYPPLEILAALKKHGKVLILDWHDRLLYPSFYERNVLRKFLKKIYYFRTESRIMQQLRMFDLCFVASPALFDVVCSLGAKPYFVQRQLFNHGNESSYKQTNGKTDSLLLYWTGVAVNQKQNEAILPALKRLHDVYKCRIVYSTDAPGNVPFIEYHAWNRDGWEQELTEADIAFRWHDASTEQRLKDANKVMAYMAAGLPVVFYPTDSEKLVVQDGVTGLMASSPKEFEEKMAELITHPDLRASMGKAAHDEMWSKFSLKSQVKKIKALLLELSQGKG